MTKHHEAHKVFDQRKLDMPANKFFKLALLLSSTMAAFTSAETALAAAPTVNSTLQEIVVTARRRSEDLQVTPVSVTALSGELTRELNIRRFEDLRFQVPNLEVGNMASGGASVTIRGIGQNSTQVNVDAKAGFYIDEMYVARQEGNNLYYYDIESLQVLKGPQGTLFGKNTTAGALLLTTARPSATGSNYLQVRVGTLNRFDTEAGINVPLNDKVLTRFSWRTQHTDGYVKHLLDKGTNNDINDKSARAQLRLLPTSKLTVDLLGEYNTSNTNGPASAVIGCRPEASYMRNYNALHTVRLCDAYPLLNDDYLVYGGATYQSKTSSQLTDVAMGGDYNAGGPAAGTRLNPFNDTEVTTVNLRMAYDLTPNLTFKSITANRRSNAKWYTPTINAPNDIYAEMDNTSTVQFTQEFNLNGEAFNKRLNYVLGAFYYTQHTYLLQDTGPDWIDPVGYSYLGLNNFKSWAVYAQASFKIIEPLELTIGTRYSKDTKDAYSDVFLQTVFTAPACNTFTNAFKSGSKICGGHLLGQDKATWDSFDPRVQLSYQVNPDIFVYGSITKGYNAGGFNQQLGSNVAQGRLVSYDPERLTSYELGLKTEWWEKRLRANVSAFFQNYSDIQTTVLININGVDTRQVATGASAREKGLEGELEFLPISRLRLRANVAYLEQHYTSVRPGGTLTLTTPVTTAPKFTFSTSASYTFMVGNAEVIPSINWRMSGKRPSCNPVGSCYLPAYGLLGGRIDFRPGDGDWTASFVATNLLDKKVPSARNPGTGGMGIDSYTVGRPRELGLEVRRSF